MNAFAMLGVLTDAAIKSTLILAAVLLIVRYQKRSAAAFRHAILAAGVFSSLALPPLTAALPQWRLAVLPAMHGPGSTLRPADPLLPELAGPPAAIHPASASIGHESGANSKAPDEASGAPSPDATLAMNWTWRRLVLLVWILGMVATLGVYLAEHVSALALVRSASSAPGDRLCHRFRQLAERMGIRRPVILRVGGRARTPMTMGIFRPTVLLSAGSRDWPPSAVDAALLHELAHIKRWDPAVQLFAWIACAIYWFNPLAWFVSARIRKEREFACDDAVLREDVEPAAYARLLVDVARAVQWS